MSLEMSCWKRMDEKNRTDGQRWGWIHDLHLTRFAPLDVDVNGQRGKAQREFLAVDFDGPQGVQRVVGNERDFGMLRFDERHRMLVTHQTVNGEARWVSHKKPPVQYHDEALGCRR